ncbi:tetratricopeptide repeat protein 27, partial [Tachysurus ichikawai]
MLRTDDDDDDDEGMECCALILPEAKVYGGLLLQRVFEGDFEGVLLSVPVLEMLSGEPEQDENIESYLQRCFITYLSTNEEETRKDRYHNHTWS